MKSKNRNFFLLLSASLVFMLMAAVSCVDNEPMEKHEAPRWEFENAYGDIKVNNTKDIISVTGTAVLNIVCTNYDRIWFTPNEENEVEDTDAYLKFKNSWCELNIKDNTINCRFKEISSDESPASFDIYVEVGNVGTKFHFIAESK